MADLKSVMAYFARHYPHKSELSKARLTKMVYLADWKSALDRGEQITDISWKFNHYGPYVDDVHRVALEDPAFVVEQESTLFGNRKERIALADDNLPISLNADEKQILDHVVEQTKTLTFDPFIKLVYSTYPVMTGTRGASMDLVKSAADYMTVLGKQAAG